MRGPKDLLDSERGTALLAILLLAFVLAILKVVTGEQWTNLAKWLGMALIAGKTAQRWASGVGEGIPQSPADSEES